jgi:hypothetical protein
MRSLTGLTTLTGSPNPLCARPRMGALGELVRLVRLVRRQNGIERWRRPQEPGQRIPEREVFPAVRHGANSRASWGRVCPGPMVMGVGQQTASATGSTGRSASPPTFVDCGCFWLDSQRMARVSAREFQHGAFARAIPRTCALNHRASLAPRSRVRPVDHHGFSVRAARSAPVNVEPDPRRFFHYRGAA